MADVKRINRMVGILGMIDRGGKVTPKGLAERFGVTARTIYRDMEALIIENPRRDRIEFVIVPKMSVDLKKSFR